MYKYLTESNLLIIVVDGLVLSSVFTYEAVLYNIITSTTANFDMANSSAGTSERMDSSMVV